MNRAARLPYAFSTSRFGGLDAVWGLEKLPGDETDFMLVECSVTIPSV